MVEIESVFNISEIPVADKVRWFVCRGTSTNLNLGRGFRTKDDASQWIDSFGYRLDWRSGFLFRLRGDDCDMSIVDRAGSLAKM